MRTITFTTRNLQWTLPNAESSADTSGTCSGLVWATTDGANVINRLSLVGRLITKMLSEERCLFIHQFLFSFYIKNDDTLIYILTLMSCRPWLTSDSWFRLKLFMWIKNFQQTNHQKTHTYVVGVFISRRNYYVYVVIAVAVYVHNHYLLWLHYYYYYYLCWRLKQTE